MRGSSCATDVFIFVVMERTRQTGNKGAQQSVTNIFIQLLEQKVGRERERERKAGGDKHDGQRKQRKSDRNFSEREQKAH